ncbi:hypothetical protein AB0K40_25625 [Nonomuraea bangladeshensis]|uniref:Uncharacterized protein n=1 Tax=Nonomuraea bangladeshensis TaxID=404385 RepID=A0ABV3H8Q4_9ACTN
MSRLAKPAQSDEQRIQQLRMMNILFVAVLAALSAGAPTWLVVDSFSGSGAGSSLVPLSAAFVVAQANFFKAIDLLDRFVR